MDNERHALDNQDGTLPFCEESGVIDPETFNSLAVFSLDPKTGKLPEGKLYFGWDLATGTDKTVKRECTHVDDIVKFNVL